MPAAATCIPKPTLGKQLLERAFAAGVRAAWVKPDSIYGGDTKPRRYLEEREQPFVLCLTSGATVTCPTRSVAIRHDSCSPVVSRDETAEMVFQSGGSADGRRVVARTASAGGSGAASSGALS